MENLYKSRVAGQCTVYYSVRNDVVKPDRYFRKMLDKRDKKTELALDIVFASKDQRNYR